MGDIQGLAESIETYTEALTHTRGLITPILLSPDNVLVAGGRRLAAHRILNRTEIAAVYSNEISEEVLRELELEENVQRLQMTWKEEVLSVKGVHDIRDRNAAQQNETWNQRKTGALLNMSQAHVSNLLGVAQCLEDDDFDILQCKNLSEALGVLLQRKENEANQLLVQTVGIPSASPQPSSSPLDAIDIIDLDVELGAPHPLKAEPTSKPDPGLQTTNLSFDLNRMFILGDCIEVMSSFEEDSFDHIVTDIPYGIDMKNLDTMSNIDLVREEHDVESNVELMSSFIPAAYRVLKPSGYLVFFYDLDHHEKLISLGKAAGFKVQRWPLIWCKSHTCVNNAAQFNWTKATEVAMVMRKSSGATLIKPQPLNYFVADGSIERKLYDNPFAKPADAWNFILRGLTIPGQRILDPFAGEMSGPRAFINQGLDFTAIELREPHLIKGVNMIKELLEEMTNGNCEFHNNYRRYDTEINH